MVKKLKPIVFHNSWEEQRLYGQRYTLEMTAAERLSEMYRLNEKLYGKSDWHSAKITELYQALPGESVRDFYRRINEQKEQQ